MMIVVIDGKTLESLKRTIRATIKKRRLQYYCRGKQISVKDSITAYMN